MEGRSLLGSIVGALIISLGGFFSHSGSHSLPPNAPRGAVEFIESQDKKSWVALYPDKLEYNFTGLFGGHEKIQFSEIKSVKKFGDSLFVNTTRGQLSFDIQGALGYSSARLFKEKLDELINKSK